MGVLNMEQKKLKNKKCVAQLVEQRPFKPLVLGSNPSTLIF
jgi:hypothetical protein